MLRLSILILLLAVGCEKDDSRELALNASFQKYCKAMHEKDSEGVMAAVDKATLDYYQNLQMHCLKSGPKELSQLPIVDRLTVVKMRIRLPANDLKQLEKNGLFSRSIKEGWLLSGQELEHSLTNIKFADKSASASRMFGEKTTNIELTFLYEDERWKFSQSQLIHRFNAGVEKRLIERKISQAEFVVKAVQAELNVDLKQHHWLPPK